MEAITPEAKPVPGGRAEALEKVAEVTRETVAEVAWEMAAEEASETVVEEG